MRAIDLVSSRRYFFAFSGVLIVISLVLLAIPPTLEPGIEFTAGTTTLIRFERDVDQADLREAYADLGHDEARIQSTGANEFLIRTSELSVPITALIEVSPDVPAAGGIPSAELGTVTLGAEGATGDVPLRAFLTTSCEFGSEIASFPAGTPAAVFEQIRDCGATDEAGGGAEGAEGEDATEGEGAAGGEDAGEGERPADGTDEDSEGTQQPDDEDLVYRVRVVALDGSGDVTGFVAAVDTHDFRAAGEPADGEEEDGAAVGDLGERGEIEEELRARFGPFDVLEFASVSAVVSKRAVRNATVAVVVASVFIMGYIVFAFSSVPRPMRYATAAILALVHDVIIVLGAFSLFGKLFETEINLMFVTGLLTIIGFSVHDTIVVFDRVRENVRLAPTAPFAENVNAALVQTLARSLNTSVTLLLTIFALLWLGGSTVQSFLLVLLVGVVAGAYSSIAIAAQVLVAWEADDVPRLFGRLRRRGRPQEEEAAAT